MSPVERIPDMRLREDAVAPLRIKSLDECSFPVVEQEVEGYKVLVLPTSLQSIFDEEGYDAIRINSVELAKKLPEYGGKTTPGQSLLPHQDHVPSNPRRFLALSKDSSENRGSATYLVHPEIVRRALPKILSYLDAHRDAIRESFVYDATTKMVSKEDLLRCFEPGGFDRLVESKLGSSADPAIKLFGYTGILTYLIQGRFADILTAEFLRDNEGDVTTEEWETNGTLIIDNSKIFHGRLGNNEHPLKRNWLVSQKG